MSYNNNGSDRISSKQVTREAKLKNNQSTAIDVPEDGEKHCSKMSWAMRLKRVFNIDVTVCSYCQGLVRIIACIEDQPVINKILAYINQQQKSQVSANVLSGIRAPPVVIARQMVLNF